MRNYRELTEREIGEIAELYPTTPNREIARRYDISVDALQDYLAHPRGWKKNYNAVLIGNRGKRSLTEKEVAWIVKHFKHTKNDDIMAKFDIGESTLHRLARKYGLKKTKQQMRKMQRNAANHANAACKKYGVYEETRQRMKIKMREMYASGIVHPAGFKPGVSNRERLGEKRFRAAIEKSVASTKETRRKERMRIRWGLPQKTKLRLHPYGLTAKGRKKINYRHNLRKRGYLIEWGCDDVYYDEGTDRSDAVEANAGKLGFTFKELKS